MSAPTDGVERALLLPVDPDGSAEKLRTRLGELLGAAPAVIITDSFGRAVAARHARASPSAPRACPPCSTCAAIPTCSAAPCRSASRASPTRSRPPPRWCMGQGDEAQPVILVRGLAWTAPDNPASELVRPAAEDMFR